MSIGNSNLQEPRPLQLTPRQQDVLRALQGRENEKYPMSQWYLGALYALANHYNPDRFSQAAQSLREVVEKLPRVVLESALQVDSYNVTDNRREIASRIADDRHRYQEGWNGKLIDPSLADTLDRASIYFEKSQQPSRRQQLQMAVVSIDPLVNQFDAEILRSKHDRISRVGKQLEGFAHHAGTEDASEFSNLQEVLETTILDLLAPITAQDQQEIRSIMEQPDRTTSDEERLFTLVQRRGANYSYFFGQADNPSWIPLLRERGYFSNPPSLEKLGDDQWNAPYWWPLQYLSRMAFLDPEQVTEIVLAFPDVDNPRVKSQILDTARKLPGVQSARLKSKVLGIGERDLPFLGHWYTELMEHWVKENETQAAQELAEVLVRFDPDPLLEEKRGQYLELGLDWSPPVSPVPRLRNWEYRRMFEQAVRPLAERDPFAMACILANAVEKMVQLRTQEKSLDEVGEEDLSEAWCRRLNRIDDSYEEPSNVLVECLTFACERVFETLPDLITELDETLRGHRWRIFNRLRQHLYAGYPSDQTKPWVREFVLGRDDYSSSSHRYEFQQMVRSACQQFGDEFLDSAERTGIFDTILNGPPKERYLEEWGDGFTDERFERRKRLFHTMQLKPFSSVLFGSYSDYFQELEGESDQEISDDNYMLIGDSIGGAVLSQSPLSPEDFAGLTDPELLDHINQWDEEFWYTTGEGRRGGFIEVSVEGLANAFRDFFREHIMLEDVRLGYWIEHLDAIERTIYVRAIVSGFDEYLKQGGLDRIEESLKICKWVLSHADDDSSDGLRDGEQSRDVSHWRNARRTVGDFVETCLREENNVSVLVKDQLGELLDLLCAQFDGRLDNNEPVRLDRFDAYDEAINNTRSRALGSLVQFGFWLRRNDPEAELSFVSNTLDKRFSPDAEYPLTLPEYGMLGENFVRMLILHPDWAAGHKSDFFPQHDRDAWRAAFGSFLHFTRSYGEVFETLKSQFWFAVDNLPRRSESDHIRSILIDGLSEHLFIYYLRGLYPLKGEESPLERFYQKTSGRTEHWGTLFRHVGFILRNNDSLDQDLKERVTKFLEWRLEQGNGEELKEFWFWLESECLEAEWRLEAFSKTLDISQLDGTEIYGAVERLNELLASCPSGVMECFAKLTEKIGNDTIVIPSDPAKQILNVGLASTEEDIRQNAERALESLLRRGKSDLLDLGG